MALEGDKDLTFALKQWEMEEILLIEIVCSGTSIVLDKKKEKQLKQQEIVSTAIVTATIMLFFFSPSDTGNKLKKKKSRLRLYVADLSIIPLMSVSRILKRGGAGGVVPHHINTTQFSGGY